MSLISGILLADIFGYSKGCEKMKIPGMLICIFLCLSLPVFAQVDTTVWYPLHDGDYWEYVAFTSPSFTVISNKVIGDTLFPNGKTYKKIENHLHGETSRFYYYERFEDNMVYIPGSGYIYDSTCTSTENTRYNFTLTDSSIWPNCSYYLTVTYTHRGFSGKGRQFINIFGTSFETAVFHNISVFDSDTTWDPLGPEWAVPIARGVGRTGFVVEPLGFFYLSGAIINGTVYGTITQLNDYNEIPLKNTFEIYPNPSNNEAKMGYSITEYAKVILLLYDVLGNEIMTIEDTYQLPGNYTVSVYTNELSSGVYFASLKAGKTALTKKLIILK
ncbi:MAG: T9SS type A sorting domain-containing protein [Ignavibacteriaceae bacterium]|nr:T9SS type A sorting domain-containing protein [Ignavibacteriaceae bacterium]